MFTKKLSFSNKFNDVRCIIAIIIALVADGENSIIEPYIIKIPIVINFLILYEFIVLFITYVIINIMQLICIPEIASKCDIPPF